MTFKRIFVAVASFPPTRLWIALMLFATTFVMYIIRVNLSISILGMVRTHKQTENETIKFDLQDVSAIEVLFVFVFRVQKYYFHICMPF